MNTQKKTVKSKSTAKKSKIDYEVGSDNVFMDLGFENPDESLVKSDLIFKISQIVKRKKYTQIQVAKIIGVDQPRVSLLIRGRLDLFSVETLMNFLNSLGQDVQIVVKPKPRNRKKARTSVLSSTEVRTPIPLAAKPY